MFADDVDTAQRLLSIAGGVLLLFVGVAMISSKLVRPLARRRRGLPARWIGGAAGALARRNSIRNPGRTAATAAALMIGVALVAFVATLANGMKASNRKAIEDQITANFIITSQDGYTPFVAAAGDAAADAPSAETVTHVRSEVAEIARSRRLPHRDRPGADHRGLLVRLDRGLRRDARRARHRRGDRRRELRRGPRPDGRAAGDDPHRREHVAGGRDQGHLQAAAVLPAAREREHHDRRVRRARSTGRATSTRSSTSRAARPRPSRAGARGRDRRLPRRAGADAPRSGSTRRIAEFDQFLTMLYVLLALSVIISLFGMVNTLVLSVFERTRELGMLRAVGMTRRQARRMIRHESVITALIGAALGLPLGIFLAVLVTPRARRVRRALRGADRPARAPRRARRDRRPARGDHAGPARGQAEPARGTALRVTHDEVRAQGALHPEAADRADRARDRARRRDDQRDLRPHRLDRQRVRPDLHRRPRGLERRHLRASRRSTSPRAAASRSRRSTSRSSTRCATLPGVGQAEGGVDSDSTSLIGKDGDAIVYGGAPNLGFAIAEGDSPFNPLRLVEGDWPGPNEIVIDSGVADKEDFAIGDEIGVQVEGPVERLRISGIVEFGSDLSIGGATLAGFDLPTAQRLFDKEGRLDEIAVAAEAGRERPAAPLRDPGDPAAERAGALGPAAGPGGCRRDERVHLVPARVPARVRRDRAVRRLVRDRELALDHDRPAHARVRDAADARRVAAPGPRARSSSRRSSSGSSRR